jgi:hypothetical protein
MRDDLTAHIPSFITLAENRSNRRVRVREMERTTTLTPTSSAAAITSGDIFDPDPLDADEVGNESDTNICILPTDYIEARRVAANTDPVSILSPISLDAARENFNFSGYPTRYTISGNYLTAYPSTDTTIDLTYYAKIPALSNTLASNWLLERAPEIYLYGALLESAPFMEDDARLATWISLYKAAVDELLQADTRGLWSRAVSRIRGITP